MTTFHELLQEVSIVQQRFERSLPLKTNPAIVSTEAIIPFKALSLREVLFHRLVDVNSTTLLLMRQDNWTQAFILLRCAIETTALLNQLRIELQNAIETKEVKKADAFLIKALVGKSGKKNWKTKPVNIQSAISKLDLSYNGFKEAYIELSGYVHPNLDGLFKSYSKWDDNQNLLILGKQQYEVDSNWGLSILHMCLVVFEEVYTELPKYIVPFSALCEEKLKKKKNNCGLE